MWQTVQITGEQDLGKSQFLSACENAWLRGLVRGFGLRYCFICRCFVSRPSRNFRLVISLQLLLFYFAFSVARSLWCYFSHLIARRRRLRNCDEMNGFIHYAGI